jgi:hypothetical protein
MSVLNLQWNANIEMSQDIDGKSLLIRGVLLDTSVNKNGWAIPQEELVSIASQVHNGVQLRLDHGQSVRDIIGGTTKGEVNSEQNKVMYEAEVDDPNVIRGILKKRIRTVSVGTRAKAFCSKCNKLTSVSRMCKCEGAHIILKENKVKEVSIVNEPAYEQAEFVPVSFVASVESALSLQKSESETKVENSLEKNKKEEIKGMTEKSEQVVVAQLDPKMVDFLASLGKQMEECVKELKKESESDKIKEEDKKKKEDDEKVKKEEAVRLEETIRKVVKEVITEEKKKEKPPVEDEGEEEEKVPAKKETAGAKVEVVRTIEAKSNAPKDMWGSAWTEFRAESKKQGVIP